MKASLVLSLALIVAPLYDSTLFAATITLSTSCTAGPVTVTGTTGCFADDPSALGYIPYADASETFSLTSTSFNGNVSSDAGVNINFGSPFPSPDNSNGLAELEFNLTTDGAVRAGFATIQAVGNVTNSSAVIRVGSFSVTPCTENDCEFSGSIPFTLGTPFQVDLESSTSGGGTFSGGGTANLQIQLFEANAQGGIGSAVTTLREATTQELQQEVTPEPSTILLALAGLAAFRFRSRCRPVS